MEFQNIKQGGVIWIFDKNACKVDEVGVNSISAPHFDIHYNTPSTMYVDIVTGDNKTYTMRADADITYCGDLVIVTEKEKLIKEVEAEQTKAKRAVEDCERQKRIVADCSRLLGEINPALKEKAEAEAWRAQVDTDIKDIKKMFAEFMAKLG